MINPEILLPYVPFPAPVPLERSVFNRSDWLPFPLPPPHGPRPRGALGRRARRLLNSSGPGLLDGGVRPLTAPKMWSHPSFPVVVFHHLIRAVRPDGKTPPPAFSDRIAQPVPERMVLERGQR